MVNPNLETARRNMVDSQIRPWEVIDERVLDLVARSPREDYVPEELRALAYVDMQLPLGHGQVMMEPKVEARLLQALDIRATDKILEIGTGSGYFSSLLAALGAHVYSVEIDAQLSARAAERLAAHGIANVTLEVGDGVGGWPAHAPYDVIVLTGSVPRIADGLRAGLAGGGRLAAVVGVSPVMTARLIRRLGPDSFNEVDLFETDLAPLANVSAPARFVF